MTMTVNPYDLHNDLESVRVALAMWQADIDNELEDPAEGSEGYWKQQRLLTTFALTAIERWQSATLAVIDAEGKE